MTAALTIWLTFIAATGTVAYFGTRRQAIAFALIAAMTLPGTFHALGRAAPWQPAPGEYTVLGARIDVDVAIYVLLNANPEPRYYRLPYSQQAANDLQAAMDATADGEGTVVVTVGENGAAGFGENVPQAGGPKRAEMPLIQ